MTRVLHIGNSVPRPVGEYVFGISGRNGLSIARSGYRDVESEASVR